MVFAGLKPDVTFDLDLFVDEGTYRALLAHGFVEDRDERGCPRIMVAAAVVMIPARLGGYGHVFAVAASTLGRHSPPGSNTCRLERSSTAAWRSKKWTSTQ